MLRACSICHNKSTAQLFACSLNPKHTKLNVTHATHAICWSVSTSLEILGCFIVGGELSSQIRSFYALQEVVTAALNPTNPIREITWAV